MSAQHTPGPWFCFPGEEWKTSEGKHAQWGCYRISAGGTDVADANYYRIGEVSNVNNSPTNEANARLVAAAPDLLAALADLLEAEESMRATYGCVHGRHPEEDDTHTHERWAERFLQERAEAARSAIAKAAGSAS